MTEDLKARLAKPRFPRSSQYDPHWIVDNLMGPHVLWLAEYLSEKLALKPGMRVLDLGCGKAVSSIFFAKEFGVHVTAADLWIKPHDNQMRIDAARLTDRVTPILAEAHTLTVIDADLVVIGRKVAEGIVLVERIITMYRIVGIAKGVTASGG